MRRAARVCTGRRGGRAIVMPRRSCPDALGVLHHVRVQGIERGATSRDDVSRVEPLGWIFSAMD